MNPVRTYKFMSVTALVIGDPHFKVSNVKETDAMAEAIISTALEKHPDIIVVMGDVLDRHEVIHVSPLTRAIKFLARLKDIAPTYVLIGNHDLKNNRQFLSDEHPFTALKYWGPNITVVDTTTTAIIKGQIFTFVPYVPPGRFKEALNFFNQSWLKSTAIFAHQEIRGAKMGAIVSTEGDEWSLTDPYLIVGHVHDFDELQPNVLYVGTPIQHAFGDRHDKTVSFFTFHSSIQRDHDRIDLGLPRKLIVRLTCGEVSTYLPQTNVELKIIISGTSGEIKAIMKHPNIEVWKRAGYRIVYKDIPLTGIVETQRPIVAKAPPRFSNVLYNAVSAYPRIMALYNRTFGNVKIATTFGGIDNVNTRTAFGGLNNVKPTIDGKLVLNINSINIANKNTLQVKIPTVESNFDPLIEQDKITKVDQQQSFPNTNIKIDPSTPMINKTIPLEPVKSIMVTPNKSTMFPLTIRTISKSTQ